MIESGRYEGKGSWKVRNFGKHIDFDNLSIISYMRECTLPAPNRRWQDNGALCIRDTGVRARVRRLRVADWRQMTEAIVSTMATGSRVTSTHLKQTTMMKMRKSWAKTSAQ